jgi:hypothetical protein
MRKTTLIVPFAMLVACGTSATPREIMDRAATQACEKAFECRDTFPNVGIAFESIYGASVEACIPRFAAALDADAVVAGVEAGTIVFRGSDADECLDAQADLTCDQLWSSDEPAAPAACDTAFEGTLELGETCAHDLECADEGAYCDGDAVCTAQAS